MNFLFFSNIQPDTVLFSRFKAVRCLSASAIGAVYLCHDTFHDNQEVALKILSAEAVSDPAKLEELRREMLVSSAIDHPNVVKSSSFFQDDQYSAFTMEFNGGGTLAELIEKHQLFSIEFVEKALIQLCAGLRSIHRAGIIHRDLKPENILIDAAKKLKIADFGVSLPMHSTETECREHLVGTMNYLSPEYIERGQIDERSDIYALGVIGYELITGRLPFQRSSLLESLLSRVRFDPEPPHLVRKDCPLALSAIILKALRRDPQLRFQSAHEMMLKLESPGTIDPANLAADMARTSLRPSLSLLRPVAA